MDCTYLTGIEDKIDLIAFTASKLEGRDSSEMYIDNVVSEDILHRFDPEDVLDIAYKFGFKINASADRTCYRADGVWLKPAEPLSDELESYGNLRYENKIKQNSNEKSKDSKEHVKSFPSFLEDVLGYVMISPI